MNEEKIVEETELNEEETQSITTTKSWLITLGIIGSIIVMGLGWVAFKQFSGKAETTQEEAKNENKDAVREVKLEPELLASAKLETENVTARPAVGLLNVTGTIEVNPQTVQMVTSLVSGRLEKIYYGIGDRVSAGQTIATISSPQVAQLHGKMHEAETKLQIAERNLNRVLKSENRVSVLQAKARLDEAEANFSRTKDLVNLNSNKDILAAEANYSSAKAKFNQESATFQRTKKIVELGAGAGKDLISAETSFKMAKADLEVAENNLNKIKDFVKANTNRDIVSAETAYKNAKAEYEFQSNISLNKEIQESKAEVETAKVDLSHIRDEMRSLGIDVDDHDFSNHQNNSSLVNVVASASGLISERMLNNGSGVEPNQSILVISNISSVWVTANVPENQLKAIRIGTIAEIKMATMADRLIPARVTFIDTSLNTDTRTAKVRLEIENPDERLRAGMFAEIGFRSASGKSEEIIVKSEAVQRIEGKEIVFVPKRDENGVFELREVETDGEIEGYTRIKKGLTLNEQVVTKGSFTLKTQFEKGAMAEE